MQRLCSLKFVTLFQAQGEQKDVSYKMYNIKIIYFIVHCSTKETIFK